MKLLQPYQRIGGGTIGAVALALSTQAFAGPCGHAYPVDAPTTLSKVASACGVSIGSLREANPGVDPANVRPGQHLAVPAQAPRGAAAPVPSVKPQYANAADTEESAGPVSTHPFIVSPGYDSSPSASKIAPVGGGSEQQSGVEEATVAVQTPLWLRTDVSGDGHYGETSRLSFQRNAAVRIRNAGYAVESSDRMLTEGVPVARFTREPATIETPHNAGGYRLPDYNAIGNASNQKAANPVSFHLTGHVKGMEGGCLLLQSADNVTWRLAAASSESLVGKTITAWGVRGAGASCGDGPSMLVSHSVHAEPW